jgi:hypothetical protein
MASFHAHLHSAVTRLRYVGARWQSRRLDPTPLLALRARNIGDVFYILGAGASVNDLSEADCQKIEGATSASINMAGLLPIEADITSLEYIADAHQAESLAARLRSRSKPTLIWFQDRKRHYNDHIARLESEFPTFRYKRASVSVRKRLDTYQHIFRNVIRPRMFDDADVRVSFAVTGSLARLTLLGCALGYRKFCYAGIDLGSTPYFWQEPKGLRGQPQWVDDGGFFNPSPTVNDFQASARVVPSFFEFLRILKQDAGVSLEFTTLDPKGRSHLTRFLQEDLGKLANPPN